MPCWEVNTLTLEFKAKNVDIMMDVLKSMGLNPSIDKSNTRIYTSIGTFNLQTGKVSVNERKEATVNKFRVKYSEKVVDVASKKFGWKIKAGKRKGKNQVFIATKW